MSTVLVVDDKDMMRDSVAETLRRAGFGVVAASDGGAALSAIAARRPDAVVTDLKMPGMSGIELLEKIGEIDTDVPVILMTAFGTIETAVDAMKRGAFDYVTKPFEGDELIIAVKRAIRHAALVRENQVLRASTGASTLGGSASGHQRHGLDRLIGASEGMRALRDQVLAVAGSHGTVLITGESGTGKEVVARAIHDLSPRGQAPFLAVNCAALSEGLLESELFGHERGAFTGAERLRKGRFELAAGGTLLLDEVSEVSPQIQAKLLRALQERAFERVGSSVTIGVDVRVLATSNRNLPAEAARGSFRSDLYFRLNVLPLHLPALRERAGDVRLLAEHFVGQICAREGIEAMTIAPDAMALLEAYPWPGNVRELQNICERAVVLLAASGRRDVTADRVGPWLGNPAEAASTPVAGPAGLIGLTPPAHRLNGHANNGHGHLVSGLNGNGVHGNGVQDHGASAGFGAAGSVTEVKVAGALADPQGGLRPLADIERDVIVRTLSHFGGHRQKTARALGIGVRTLGLKLKKWKEERLVPPTL